MTARCPVCNRRVSLVGGRLARHKEALFDAAQCEASGRTTFEATVILAKRMAQRGPGEVGGHG